MSEIIIYNRVKHIVLLPQITNAVVLEIKMINRGAQIRKKI